MISQEESDGMSWSGRMKFKGGTMEVDGWMGLMAVAKAMGLGQLAG
ncbi:MAG: hypothetical protein LR011_01330 [Verrucomicrobia bacterium]|nr:hypothetical protein [Verrucomicrobiota bacterium]